ncbi:MAG: FecR domain-containing protein [Parachlamydiaceae bacterium]|nr:FecR domain-containing protein [Parachlamydiaceae bacterium]
MINLKHLLFTVLIGISSQVVGVEIDPSGNSSVKNKLPLQATPKNIENKPWKPFIIGNPIKEGSKFQTGPKEELRLQFSEGSIIRLNPQTIIAIDSLEDPLKQPLINIILETGEIRIHMIPYNAYRNLIITAGQSMLIASETEPTFSVKQKDLTTVAVENGTVTIQMDNPELQSIYLHSGEQVSFNASKMGPIVAVGAPPSLEEPKDLSFRRLDLGYMQQCESTSGLEEICGTWSWNKATQRFDAAWNNGEKAVLKVEKMSDGEIVLTRDDEKKNSTIRTARYVGHNEGVQSLGDVIFQLIKGTVSWEKDGVKTEGAWHATSSQFLDLGKKQQ